MGYFTRRWKQLADEDNSLDNKGQYKIEEMGFSESRVPL